MDNDIRLRVFCSENQLQGLPLPVTPQSLEDVGIVLIDRADAAQLCIYFTVTISPSTTRLPVVELGSQLPHTVSADDGLRLLRVFRAAARFNHYLFSTFPRPDNILVELRRAEGSWTENGFDAGC